jgi:phosphoribosylformylglycinamidine synthase
VNDIRTEDLVPVDPADAAGAKAFFKQNGVSLTPGEYARVCELLGRRPTLTELHIFNTMWSEHCSYKSSRAVLREYLPTDAPHVVLGPGEDAGVIRFAEIEGKSWCLVMAHESHNHPSQVLPVEGAATGIGGIVRDVYCMGADVIGVMDPLRFGDPHGPHASRVRDIAWGVVDGIAQYGNALGVPTYGGETYFDATFDDNCLVNVVAFGVVAEDGIIRSRVPDAAREEPYEIILIGKPTDASGFGGAAFASERLSEEEAVERQGAVQVPDPFLKRVLAEAQKEMLAWAREKKVPIGYKDLGAGGISCAASEMAAAAGLGVALNLDDVNLAFSDMPAEVISCSETQERFLLAVPARLSQEVLEIYNTHFEMPHLYEGAGAYVIGRVTPDKRFHVSRGARCVSDAGVQAITTGIAYAREAKQRARKLPSAGWTHAEGAAGIREALLGLLGSINIADKSPVFQHYDSEVQGRAVLRPGEADASVEIFLPGHPVALAASCGGASRLGAISPYLGGAWSVLEAARNVACVGARPLAVTDCLNFGDPEDPGVFWEFTEAVRGIGDACRALRVFEGAEHGVPVISGNVSFYNQSETGDAIAPTPIVACAARLDDASRARDLAFEHPGARVALLGRIHADIAGSEYEKYYGSPDAAAPPRPDLASEPALLLTLIDAFAAGLVAAAHDISHGGLLVTLAEMALASAPEAIGCEIDLAPALDTSAPLAHQLFSEFGGIVVEVPQESWQAFEELARARGADIVLLGRTTPGGGLRVTLPAGESIELSVAKLRDAHRGETERVIFG